MGLMQESNLLFGGRGQSSLKLMLVNAGEMKSEGCNKLSKFLLSFCHLIVFQDTSDLLLVYCFITAFLGSALKSNKLDLGLDQETCLL